ncbi:uncharacterized protein MONBRDRAFT_26554 [Monosiga brevicollis MX1]|uniref:Ankyrin repeat protein n=1 Tax=Monosiga brevicollis TaxID=81824 RepID=A9V2Q1_MONBE|nr:uncharacterized protein MONBRDRAFT_26554 [Monosiga brevicollis MX1]EDQ88300.1 predicted protein [Monosiga brevicollis MX1]|eukprot:XP_001746893.1 hypothetical protein [Monosiga brevicollis MX1]
MSNDGKALYDACDSSDSQKALDLLNSWSADRVRDAVRYKEEKFDCTPLHKACSNGHADVVRVLLKYDDVDVNAKNKHRYAWQIGDASLHNACALGDHADVVRVLLDHGDVDVNERGAVHGAAGPHWVKVAVLGMARTPHSCTCQFGWTPLHWACDEDHIDVARLVLGHNNIDVRVKDYNGYTARSMAEDSIAEAWPAIMEHIWRARLAVLVSKGYRVEPALFSCLWSDLAMVEDTLQDD